MIGDKKTKVDFRVGRIGELLVELQLVERGWHPVRLDTAQMAANADLLAINREKRVSIQVKTTNAEDKHSHSHCLNFGYATSYLLDKLSIFNSKKSPLIADIVIGVHYTKTKPRFVVLPVGFAEKLCRVHADYWYNVKRGRDDGTRSPSFPLYIHFTRAPKKHSEHHTRLMDQMLEFEDAWHLLSELPEKLRDPSIWPVK